MSQGHLFDNPVSVGIERAMHAPIAAAADPSTSHQAARAITASGKRQVQLQGVLALVKRYPMSTSLELSRKAINPERWRAICGRRLPELERGGLVRRTGVRKCSISGMNSTIWEAM